MKRTTRKILIMAAGVLLTAGLALSQQNNSSEAKLRAAMDKETVDGDLKGAIEQYRKLAQDKDRTIALRASMRMAGAYEKLRDSEARRIYESIVRDFPDQKEAVATAKAKLGAANPGTFTKRVLDGACADPDGYLSPDARWSVLTDWDTNDLAICDLATGRFNPLFVRTGNNEFSYPATPVVSPDLRHIVYAWDFAEKGRNAQLRMVANEPHSKPQILLDRPEYDWFEVADFFPDGKSVLVAIRSLDQTWQLARVAVDNGKVEILKSLGWRLRDVRGHARLSPDGRYVAYPALAENPTSAKGPLINTDQHIFVLAVNGSAENEVIKTAGVNGDPLWANNGRLFFTSDRSGSLALWSLAVANGKAVGSPSLAVQEIGKVEPIGIRNGSYFYHERTERVESIAIVATNREAGNPVTTETFAGLAPSWSPDGKWIAFKRHLPGGKTNDFVLVVRSVDTGDEKLYPTSLGITGNGTPIWLHDSKSVITGFVNSAGTRSPHRVDLTSGELKPFSIGGGELSPDDKTMYRVVRDPDGKLPDRVEAVDVNTGEQRQIFDSPAVGKNQGLAIALSPDGRTLAVGWLEITPAKLHIGSVSVDGSGFRELHGDNDHLYGAGVLRWTPDGKSILFRREQPEGASHWGVMRIPAEGAATATLVAKSSVMTGFDVSPDGSRIVIGDATQSEHLVALDNLLSVVK